MIALETGWTFREIDNLTIPEFEESFVAFWEETPPLCQMVAAFFGVGGKKAAKGSMDDLIAQFGAQDLTKGVP